MNAENQYCMASGTQNSQNFSIGVPLRLGHLPLVMGVFRNIGMSDIIDHAIGQDNRSIVSCGECVSTILSGVFVGAHSLWRLEDRLSAYDMRTVMQDNSFDLARFPEERLAKALDDLYAFGLDKLMTAIALQAIKSYDIGMDTVHFDTTSLSFYGAYESDDPWSMIDGIQPPPKVTYGHSKAHRPDLKQVLFGQLISSDGGIPLIGKALDGNMSDNHAAAQFFGRVRELVKDPHDVVCVADSKGWCGRVVEVVQKERLRLLSRLPRNRSNHAAIMKKEWIPDSIIEIPRKSGKIVERYELMGFDIDETFEVEDIEIDGTKNRRTVQTKARAIRVYSTALLRTKMSSVDRMKIKDERKSKKKILDWQDAAYACESDALRAADRNVHQSSFATLDLTAEVIFHEGPAKKGRGRPRFRPEPALNANRHWRVIYRTIPMKDSEIAKRLHSQASFVLIRTRNSGWEISDEEMIRTYKGQYHAEHGFSWLKSGADINPIFIQTPHRIAALCFIYCLGLMLWTIIQRTVRANLKKWNTGLPYHRNKPSANITTRFLFELFPCVSSIPIIWKDGKMTKQLAGITEIQELACKAAGLSIKCYHPIA